MSQSLIRWHRQVPEAPMGGLAPTPRRLPNGAPAQRLRYLAQHLHELGPRVLLGFLKELLEAKMPDALAVVKRLEYYAEFPPDALRALGGHEIPPPVFDITWTFRPSPFEADARSEADAESDR